MCKSAGWTPAFVCLKAGAKAEGMITGRSSSDPELMSCRRINFWHQV